MGPGPKPNWSKRARTRGQVSLANKKCALFSDHQLALASENARLRNVCQGSEWHWRANTYTCGLF